MKSSSMMKTKNKASYSLPPAITAEDLKRVTHYNPFLSSNATQNILEKKYKVGISNSLATKKHENSLFVGGELLRKLGAQEAKRRRQDRREKV